MISGNTAVDATEAISRIVDALEDMEFGDLFLLSMETMLIDVYKRQGYDRWAAKHNLKQMAATVTAYQQYGFSSPEELDEACSAAYAAMQESLTELKQVEKTLD